LRLFCLSLLLAGAALAVGPPAPTLLDAAFHHMYNLDFDQAHRTLAEWQRTHPDDPMGPASDAAAYLYYEFDRLHILQSEFFVDDDAFLNRKKESPDPRLRQKFFEVLAKSEQLASKVLARSPLDENALLAANMRLGLRADYAALIDKKYLPALRDTRTARQIAETLLKSHPDCYDAYMAIGIENYMLSLKPAPLRWILRLGGAQTDRAEGIRKLKLTAEKGRYFKPYARLLLAVAAARDKDTKRARDLLVQLAREFPRNGLYARELARLERPAH
jgi:hypothetical protein